MGAKLVYKNPNPVQRSSRPTAKLTLIHGQKDVPQLWAGNPQVIPLPGIIVKNFICHKCGETDEYYVLSEKMIHCYHCNLTSIQDLVSKA